MTKNNFYGNVVKTIKENFTPEEARKLKFSKELNKKIMENRDERMKDAIYRSGYLQEVRADKILREQKYLTEPNKHYSIDGEETMEIDLFCKKVFANKNAWKNDDHKICVHVFLLIECKNKSDYPTAFFKNEGTEIDDPRYQRLTYTAKPSISDRKHLLTFIEIEDIHHYWDGNSFIATQFCIFNEDKREVLKADSSSSYIDFLKLYKCVEYFQIQHLEFFSNDIHINFFYPVLLVEGELKGVTEIEGGEIELSDQRHVQYQVKTDSRDHFDRVSPDCFHVDVIELSYLSEYLKMINKETKKIVKELEKQCKKILEGVESKS